MDAGRLLVEAVGALRGTCARAGRRAELRRVRRGRGEWWRSLAMAVALAGMSALTLAAPAKRFAESACFKQAAGAPATQACEQLARDVSHDIGAVRALGDELERSGRFEEAAVAYRVALSVHPEHRDLMQRMIRARGQSRSLRMLNGSSAAPPTAQATAIPPVPAPRPVQPPSTSQPALKVAASVPERPPAIPSDGKGRYIALLIGNEQYSNFTPLKTPVADTRVLAQTLERDYGFTTTVLTNATRYQVVSALSRLRREATENDNVLIYYAGHGYLDDATSRGYWLPVDAERDNIANWLSTSDITDVLAGVQARHAIILADSCFSGSLLRSDPTVAIDERQSLLRKLATRRSRSIMTSGGLEPVSDDGGGKHSVFASALIRALRDNRQQLEAGRLFMQIRERVALGASQTPQYGPLRNAGHDGGDFIFDRSPSRRR